MYCPVPILSSIIFFFNVTATTEIYTLSLHDALPISSLESLMRLDWPGLAVGGLAVGEPEEERRSEEHTSELQSRFDLVCRLLLEKKKKLHNYDTDLQIHVKETDKFISREINCESQKF